MFPVSYYSPRDKVTSLPISDFCPFSPPQSQKVVVITELLQAKTFCQVLSNISVFPT